MIVPVELNLTPEEAANELLIKNSAASQLNISSADIRFIYYRKKSVDARKGKIIIRLVADVYVNEDKPVETFDIITPAFKVKEPVVIVGAGPAGLFAALRLLELGIKPLIIERGKDVRNRRRDLAEITRKHIVNPESNYCFGEGGAGTYSDGKLYTRASKRGDVNRILNIFVKFGADETIRYDAHPHIGTNKLPQIITAIREFIIAHGGEICFESKLTDIYMNKGRIEGIEINGTQQVKASSVILATGHSARDIFHLLNDRNIYIESKPFALGVRVEHPQALIDSIQYHCKTRSEYLPPASYSLVDQQEGRGVFSFCMCPGGIIAPAATSGGEIVVNGWSPSKRNNPFANSGLVVSVGEEDFAPWKDQGALAALYFQQSVEQAAFVLGGNNLQAPAQRMVDFVEGRKSTGAIETSYLPGVKSCVIEECLPESVSTRLKGALKSFAKKMPRYYTNEAVLVATESRSSSPVRIPRDRETFEHPEVQGLFPCGEGAGYAGGIVSAAMDGERVADAVVKMMK